MFQIMGRDHQRHLPLLGQCSEPRQRSLGLLSGQFSLIALSKLRIFRWSWYSYDPAKYAEFRQRYEADLTAEQAQAALARLRALAQQGQVTLVVAAHDLEHSTA